MIWSYIFNPLSKLPSKPILLVGIVTAVIGAFISQFNQTIYDGIFDAHVFSPLGYAKALTANMVNIIIPCIVLFILARIINPKTRMIDILNTAFLYRLPIYILPLLTKISVLKDFDKKMNNGVVDLKQLNFTATENLELLIITCLSLALLAYAICLMFFGFKTASNAKKAWHFISFVFVVIFCEVICKYIVHILI